MNKNTTTTLVEILSELEKFPKDLIVKSASLKMETQQGTQ